MGVFFLSHWENNKNFMFSYVTVYVTDVMNCWRYDWNLKGNTVYLSLSSKSSRGDTHYSNDLSGDHVIMYWIKSFWMKAHCTLKQKKRNWSVLCYGSGRMSLRKWAGFKAWWMRWNTRPGAGEETCRQSQQSA